LLAEYEQINEDIRTIRAEGLNRLNFFITITSAILGALIVFSESSVASALTVQLVSIGALSFLTLLGLSTFQFTIKRDKNVDYNLRALARIRRYFVSKHPYIRKHISLSLRDGPTPFVTKNESGIRGLAQSIICTIHALNVGLITYLYVANAGWSIGAGVITFLVTWMFLEMRARAKYREIEEEAKKYQQF